MAKYWYKYPRQTFAERAGQKPSFSRTAEAMQERIEKAFAAGRTGEPYVQLVEETDTNYRVIAEWSPNEGWMSHAEAAGFVSRPVAA